MSVRDADKPSSGHATSNDTDTVAHIRGASGSGLHVRCPHCHNPIELLLDAELESIHCTACGSDFSLTTEDGDATRDARSLAEIGHFKLVERIGVGAFGTVWKAQDKELDRTVAVKIPRAGQLDKARQELFLREARSAAQLRHPNIVPVYEVGRDGDTLYIVSEFVRGVTLADRLTAGPYAAREAAELCAKIADALHHAHEEGVVHRDLKPPNVMIDDRGEPHIMDFGLARREAGEVTMTLDGQVLGTPAYMSPEQAQGESHDADRRSDVYSLGVILFELLTGELPFRGNARMLIQQVIHDEAPSPRKFNGGVPKDLETITVKCLQKDPKRRFATAADMAAELRRHLAGEAIHSRPITAVERAWRWCQRKPGVAALSGAVAALIAVVAIGGPLAALREKNSRLFAELKQSEATAAQAQAESNAVQAKANEARAEAARADLEKTNDQLADSKRAAERTLYARTISLAQQEWDNANIMHAEALLESADDDSRGWEWRYLKYLCHTDLITLRGAQAPVTLVAMHADGRHVAAVSQGEKMVRTWSWDDGQLVASHEIEAIAISPDGRFVAGVPYDTGSLIVQALVAGASRGRINGFLSVYDARTGKNLKSLKGHDAGALFGAFNADGSRLVTAGRDQTIRVWDSASGAELLKIVDSERLHVRPVAISPDGRRIGWKTFDGWIVVHDVDANRELLRVNEPQYTGAAPVVAFNLDGTLLASAVGDQIAVWGVDNGQRRMLLHGHRGSVMSLQFSPRHPLLASSSFDGTVRLWNLNSGREVLCLRGHQAGATYGVACVSFSADGQFLASGGSDALVKVWDSQATGAMIEPELQYPTALGQPTMSSVWQTSPDCRQDLAWLSGHMNLVRGMDFLPGHDQLATCSADGSVKIFDLTSRTVQRDFVEHGGPVGAVQASPDGKLIASGGGGVHSTEPGTILVWSAESGKVLKTLTGHAGPISALRFTPNGQRLISASGSQQRSDRGELFVWDLATDKVVARAKGINAAITGLDLAPDGQTIATCGYDAHIRLWNADSCQHLRDLGAVGDVYYAVDFSRDGRRLAAGDGRWRVSVFDLDSGAPVWTGSEHSGAVCGVSYIDDQRLLSCGLDGSARLWDAESGEVLLVFRDYPSDMYCAEMSPDGRYLICCGAEPRLSVRMAEPPAAENSQAWEVILSDDFQREEIGDKWEAVNGAWTIENGAARGVLQPERGDTGVLVATLGVVKDMPPVVEVSYDAWSPAVLNCETKLMNDANQTSIIALYSALRNESWNRGETGYIALLQFDPNNYQQAANRASNFTLNQEPRHRFRTVRDHNRLRMYVDDVLVLESEVPAGMVVPLLRLQGSFGQLGDVVYFDNVVVRAPR